MHTFSALTSNAIPPQADGDAIDVPFMSIRRCRVHVGTGATAPPGALIETPTSPSAVGPRLDLHVFHNLKSNQNCNPRHQSVIIYLKARITDFEVYLPSIFDPFRWRFNNRMSTNSHFRGDICTNSNNGGCGTTRCSNSAQSWTTVTSATHKYEMVLVYDLTK